MRGCGGGSSKASFGGGGGSKRDHVEMDGENADFIVFLL